MPGPVNLAVNHLVLTLKGRESQQEGDSPCKETGHCILGGPGKSGDKQAPMTDTVCLLTKSQALLAP